jgi:putative heme-binding domain-containing protein
LPAFQAGKLKFDGAQLPVLVRADGTADTVFILRQVLADPELEPEERLALSITLADVGGPDDIAYLIDFEHWTWASRRYPLFYAQLLDHLALSNRKVKPRNAADLLNRLDFNHPETEDHLRTAALRLTGAWKMTEGFPGLLDSTGEKQKAVIRLAGIDGLARYGGERAKARLIELAGEGDLGIRTAAIAGLTNIDLPEAARQAVGALFASDANAETIAALLPAFLERKDGSVILAKQLKQQLPPPLPALAEAGLQQLNALGRHDEELFTVLTEIAGTKKEAMRATPEFVAALAKEVRESGDAKHGDEIFHRAEVTCTACHSVGGQGGTIGPSLDSIGSGQPLDFIIGAVIEPQREVKESFEAVEITTKDGRLVQGYKVREANGELVLKDVAQGIETKFAKDQIAARREIGSLMPPGLLERLSREEQRDLFRYLSELGKPK